MEIKKHEERTAAIGSSYPTMGLKSDELRRFFEDETFQSFFDKQPNRKHFSEKVQEKTDVFGSDSEEEMKLELENALKQYKKNKSESGTSEKDRDSTVKKFKQENEKTNGNPNPASENISTDLQELTNYFFFRTRVNDKKSVEKSYSDYEKQGAIPKRIRKEKVNSNEKRNIIFSSSEEKSSKIVSKKDGESTGEIFESDDSIEKQRICNFPKSSQFKSSEFVFIINSNCNEVIVKINEEICSRPFFYVVPENPSPNFFLSSGSYYVIPKNPNPNSITQGRIIFHPENKTSDKNRHYLEEECSQVSGEDGDLNNLGENIAQKVDSHLNIGPQDVKVSESANNLETNFCLSKTYNKAFLSSSSSVSDEPEPQTRLANVAQIISKTNGSLNAANQDQLCIPQRKNFNENEYFPNELDNRDEKMLSLNLNLEKILKKYFDNIKELKLDHDSVEDFEKTYLFDELGLRKYIKSENLKQKMENQFLKMVSALPDCSTEELQNKLLEFQGDEILVENYIVETKRILEMQVLFPDADPNFLREEIARINDDEDAYCSLINRLIDSRNYPKISEDLNGEKKRLWQLYVENFCVESFIRNVPEHDFAGIGGNNKASKELIFKFLTSRYPEQSIDFLKNSFESHDNNLTKTCDALNQFTVVALSKSSFRKEDWNENFLKEICYIDHKEEIENYVEEMKELRNFELMDAISDGSFLFCPICLDDTLLVSDIISCSEGHICCKKCLLRYVNEKFINGIYKYLCPSENCDSYLDTVIIELLPDTLALNILKKQQAEEIISAKVDGLEFCPYCEFAYIPNAEDKVFKCQNSACLKETCRRCREKSHIPLRCEEIERPIDLEARKQIEEVMTNEFTRTCPTCQRKFFKTEGCNKIMCTCGTILCYICRKVIRGYDHFNTYGRCRLNSSASNEQRNEVLEAGVRTKNQILKENPNIRIMHDPTTY